MRCQALCFDIANIALLSFCFYLFSSMILLTQYHSLEYALNFLLPEHLGKEAD